ncbi:MAG: hypothetical protein DME23_22680 [Verrucomicrobia bacterium]|nr:MAG: hypothetical protein DME23_22680 [Verrucomicrobiota bacterium]
MFGPLTASVAPLAITVVPPPPIAPPVQFSVPLTVTVPLPPRPPPLKVTLLGAALLLKFAVAPLITVLLAL